MIELLIVLLHAALAGLCAWIFTGVLNQPGMLLYRPYRAVYDWLGRRYGNVEENAPMWWKPAWGCTTCSSTWYGLLTYICHVWLAGWEFRPDYLLYSGAVAMLAGILLSRAAEKHN